MIWTILGWMVWAFVALFALAQWESKFRNRDDGVRILAGRCAFLFTVALVVTAVTPIHKLHLLWACPVLYVSSMMATGVLMRANASRFMSRVKRESRRTGEPLMDVFQREVTRLQAGTAAGMPAYSAKEMAEIDTLVASGDKEGATARIAEFQAERREQLKEQGIDLDSFVPEVGKDIQWSDVVRQVCRILEFNRCNTTIGEDGKPKSESLFTPYGYFLVESPIFNQPVRLPIIHRDDFLLVTLVFDAPNRDQILEEAELLVTYAPKRTRRDGKNAGFTHVLHYVLCPHGTLERYYAFDNDIHMREPMPEKLFGKFVYVGETKVEVNQQPAF